MVEFFIDTYDSFTKSTVDSREYNTPGIPHISIVKNGEEEPINVKAYRKIVGKIMYLVTTIIPEGANTARELSRFFSNPGEEHWKSLKRFIGFLQTYRSSIRLTRRRPKELRVGINVDSNYATNKEDRKSVTQ